MSNPRRTVVISLLGINLDRTIRENRKLIPERWERWRPTLSLCQQEDFVPDRLELLAQPQFKDHATALLDDIASVSPETETNLHMVPFRDAWDFSDVYATLRSFADAYQFDEDEEEYFVHMTTGTHVAQICLFMLAETRHVPARLIQTSPPASDRRSSGRTKQNGTYRVIDLDLSRYDQLAARFAAEHAKGASFLKAGIETRSENYNAMMERIEVVASSSPAPILLTGATGVGKTQLARRIFELKKRQAGALGDFVEVNCATLRGDGAMSTLFGHAKGAFTGAASQRDGLLKAADKGVLFLDEIGELGLDEQAMLLRAIEDGIFTPLGSDRAVRSQFQLIAGTNRDLFAAVAKGEFREDLLARIDLWSFELPRLSERAIDVEPNLDFELARHAKSAGRKVSFNKEARKRFLEFAAAPTSLWLANFRDFGAAITRLVTLAGSKRVTAALVEEEISRLENSWRRIQDGTSKQAQATSPNPESDLAYLTDAIGPAAHEIDLFDRAQLVCVIRVCRSSKSLAAAGRVLFAESRKRKTTRNDSDRLKKYLSRFDLTWTGLAAASAGVSESHKVV